MRRIAVFLFGLVVFASPRAYAGDLLDILQAAEDDNAQAQNGPGRHV